ncbi:MAG: tRNA 2-thiouridine(34) synthase MnmA [Candidatus Latescibacterota bacterium]
MGAKRVVVAMSGGVDSSVTAVLLKQEGYEVIGITMQVWPNDRCADGGDPSGGCCGLEAVNDARGVASGLGVPYYVLNFREVFQKRVIADFCEEYKQGRTPNPCIRCNQYMKFDLLLERARQLGAAFLATGHYARIEQDAASGRVLLKKGVDLSKDQSYVLYVMTQDQLKHVLMPMGAYTKKMARQMARDLELPVANKPESQEICFIPDDDYGAFLQEMIPESARPGPILNQQGDILGTHRGIPFYTIGQRKGLGIAAREPLYVVAIDREKNAIIVGNEEEVYADHLVAAELNWIAIDELTGPMEVRAKIRYLHPEAEAVVSRMDRDSVSVTFREPQRAITPGQAVVFYQGDVVIGGGTIR